MRLHSLNGFEGELLHTLDQVSTYLDMLEISYLLKSAAEPPLSKSHEFNMCFLSVNSSTVKSCCPMMLLFLQIFLHLIANFFLVGFLGTTSSDVTLGWYDLARGHKRVCAFEAIRTQRGVCINLVLIFRGGHRA